MSDDLSSPATARQPRALPVDAPSPTARAAAATLVSSLGAELGRLPALGEWLAGVQGTAVPLPFRRVRLVLVGAAASLPVDHVQVSATTVALEALATAAQCGIRTVHTAAPSSAVATHELSADEFDAAYELGRWVADDEADAGTDLLLVGLDPEPAGGDLAAASALVAAMLDREPVAVVGTEWGGDHPLDDRGWMQRVAAVRDALRRTRFAAGDRNPAELLQLIGGARLAAAAGLLTRSAVRRTPVLLDGTAVCSAALAAARLAPSAELWWTAATRPTEPAGREALDALELDPLLDLGIRTGDGSGALLAVPLLLAAIEVVGQLTAAAETDAGGSG